MWFDTNVQDVDDGDERVEEMLRDFRALVGEMGQWICKELKGPVFEYWKTLASCGYHSLGRVNMSAESETRRDRKTHTHSV